MGSNFFRQANEDVSWDGLPGTTMDSVVVNFGITKSFTATVTPSGLMGKTYMFTRTAFNAGMQTVGTVLGSDLLGDLRIAPAYWLVSGQINAIFSRSGGAMIIALASAYRTLIQGPRVINLASRSRDADIKTGSRNQE